MLVKIGWQAIGNIFKILLNFYMNPLLQLLLLLLWFGRVIFTSLWGLAHWVGMACFFVFTGGCVRVISITLMTHLGFMQNRIDSSSTSCSYCWSSHHLQCPLRCASNRKIAGLDMAICSKKCHRIKISGQICFSVVIILSCTNSTVARHCSLIFSLGNYNCIRVVRNNGITGSLR